MVLTVFSITCFYFGAGFLFTRFISFPRRNNPIIWLICNVMVLPILIGTLSAIFSFTYLHVLFFCACCFPVGFCVEKKFSRKTPIYFPNSARGIRQKERIIFLSILCSFFVFLILPKLSLVFSHEPSIGDDFGRVRTVVSTGYDVSSPRFAENPEIKLSYHFFDFLIPGAVFRVTNLSASEAWFIHNVFEYIALLSLFYFAVIALCTRLLSRLFLLLSFTYASGGFEYVIYRMHNYSMGSTKAISNHVEWWGQIYGHLNSGQIFQISSVYTTLLWAPHHAIAAAAALIAIVLFVSSKSIANKLSAGFLMGGTIGFSVFVFITGILIFGAVMLLELFWNLRSIIPQWKREALRYILAVMSVFVSSFPTFLLYLYQTGESQPQKSILSANPPFLRLFTVDSFAQTQPEYLAPFFRYIELFLNYVFGTFFIVFIELGIVSLLAVAYFLFHKKNTKKMKSTIPPTIFWLTVITLPLVTVNILASGVSNDMFLRGIIPAQIGIAIAAGLFLDLPLVRLKRVWILIPVLICIQTSNFFVEFTGRTYAWSQSRHSEVHDYIANFTPKNATIFVDHGKCGGFHDLVFDTHRLCVKGVHDSNEVLQSTLPHKYFLTQKTLQADVFKLVAVDHEMSRFLYAVK